MHPLRLKQLMEEVVNNLPVPHTEDVIDDAFHAIESDPALRKRYDQIAYELGKPAVNAWGGFWVAHFDARTGDEQVPAAKATLIDSYHRLTTPAAKRGKKVKEPEAVALMSEHYRLNRESLPANVIAQRAVITQLIMAGIAPGDAFAQALQKPTLAR